MEAPAEGSVFTRVNDREFRLTEAEYWVEGEVVAVRSREFDCFATGKSLDDALDNFGRAVLDYAETLQERNDNGEVTATEREILKKLSARLSRMYLEERHAPRRRRALGWLRRGNDRDREWGPLPAKV